jgi:hypothetical protein
MAVWRGKFYHRPVPKAPVKDEIKRRAKNAVLWPVFSRLAVANGVFEE